MTHQVVVHSAPADLATTQRQVFIDIGPALETTETSGGTENNPFHLNINGLSTVSGLPMPGDLVLVSAFLQPNPQPPPSWFIVQDWSYVLTDPGFEGSRTGIVFPNPNSYFVSAEFGGVFGLPQGPLNPEGTERWEPCIAAILPGATIQGTFSEDRLDIQVSGLGSGTCGGGARLQFQAEITAAKRDTFTPDGPQFPPPAPLQPGTPGLPGMPLLP